MRQVEAINRQGYTRASSRDVSQSNGEYIRIFHRRQAGDCMRVHSDFVAEDLTSEVFLQFQGFDNNIVHRLSVGRRFQARQ